MILSSLVFHGRERTHHQTNRSSHDNGESSSLVASMSPPQSIASIPSPPLMTPTNTTIHGVPKILWLYWDRGLDHLAQIGGPNSTPNKYQADYACVKTWQLLHPTWEIRILNQTQAMKLAPKFAHLASFLRNGGKGDKQGVPETRVCPVKLGNLLRTELLTLYGGVYADTSICPMRPLEDYLGKLVKPQVGFYVPPYFRLVGDMNHSQLKQYERCYIRGKSNAASQQLADPARMVDNFFMVSRPGNLILKQWMQAYYRRLLDTIRTTPDYWDVCRKLPYYIHQCTFTLQVLHNPQFEQAWKVFRKWQLPKNGHWQNTSTSEEGICFGGGKDITYGRYEVQTNVQHVKNNCFWLKKQNGALLDYVRSPAYHQDISSLWSERVSR